MKTYLEKATDFANTVDMAYDSFLTAYNVCKDPDVHAQLLEGLGSLHHLRSMLIGFANDEFKKSALKKKQKA
jgi:hypothetical protein